MTNDDMLAWLRRCEGYKSHPYLDTAGKVTIGFGRNLDAKGLSLDEADYLLRNDLDAIQRDLKKKPWFVYQPDGVQDALTNMAFNLGIEGMLEFKEMIDAIIRKDYALASREALDSPWAKETGQRARDIAIMIREAK